MKKNLNKIILIISLMFFNASAFAAITNVWMYGGAVQGGITGTFNSIGDLQSALISTPNVYYGPSTYYGTPFSYNCAWTSITDTRMDYSCLHPLTSVIWTGYATYTTSCVAPEVLIGGVCALPCGVPVGTVVPLYGGGGPPLPATACYSNCRMTVGTGFVASGASGSYWEAEGVSTGETCTGGDTVAIASGAEPVSCDVGKFNIGFGCMTAAENQAIIDALNALAGPPPDPCIAAGTCPPPPDPCIAAGTCPPPPDPCIAAGTCPPPPYVDPCIAAGTCTPAGDPCLLTNTCTGTGTGTGGQVGTGIPIAPPINNYVDPCVAAGTCTPVDDPCIAAGTCTGTGTGPGGTAGTGTGSFSQFCTDNPNASSCASLDVPAGIGVEQIGTNDVNMSAQAFTGYQFTGGGNCPAPRNLNLAHGQIIYSWQPFCDFLTVFRLIALAVAYFVAALIMLGQRTAGSD